MEKATRLSLCFCGGCGWLWLIVIYPTPPHSLARATLGPNVKARVDLFLLLIFYWLSICLLSARTVSSRGRAVLSGKKPLFPPPTFLFSSFFFSSLNFLPLPSPFFVFYSYSFSSLYRYFFSSLPFTLSFTFSVWCNGSGLV